MRVWRAKEAKVCLVGETKVARVATGAGYEPLVLPAPYRLSCAEFTHAISLVEQREAWAYSADQGAAYQLVREHPVAYLVGKTTSVAYTTLQCITAHDECRQIVDSSFDANIRKRQLKSPKIYVRDSGLLHQLLGISSDKGLPSHPRTGASWEGFVIEQVIALAQPDDAYFRATHQGAEIDLVLSHNGNMYGVECKRTDA
jgi:hypothetical protein